MKKFLTTKWLRFISKNKAIINANRHADIMDDAIDRIVIKEAKINGEFVNWEDAKSVLDKKHKVYGFSNRNRKTTSKISGRSAKKRLR
jgi:hypothetical protein